LQLNVMVILRPVVPHEQQPRPPIPTSQYQPGEDHPRPNGPVLTPQRVGHVIPSAVTPPRHRRQGHGLDEGLLGVQDA
jgi:hypothetical protein